MAGIFGEFSVVSVSQKTKHEKSSKNLGKIRSKIRDENSKKEREKKNIGELSLCNFSELTRFGTPVDYYQIDLPCIFSKREEDLPN